MCCPAKSGVCNSLFCHSSLLSHLTLSSQVSEWGRGDKRPPLMCLLLIWPAASGHSEATHHPLSVTASHRLVTLTRARVAGPQPPRPLTLGSAHNPAHALITLSLAYYEEADWGPGLQQAAGTNICMHFYEAPCLLGPSPLCLVSDSCLVGGGRDC